MRACVWEYAFIHIYMCRCYSMRQRAYNSFFTCDFMWLFFLCVSGRPSSNMKIRYEAYIIVCLFLYIYKSHHAKLGVLYIANINTQIANKIENDFAFPRYVWQSGKWWYEDGEENKQSKEKEREGKSKRMSEWERAKTNAVQTYTHKCHKFKLCWLTVLLPMPPLQWAHHGIDLFNAGAAAAAAKTIATAIQSSNMRFFMRFVLIVEAKEFRCMNGC